MAAKKTPEDRLLEAAEAVCHNYTRGAMRGDELAAFEKLLKAVKALHKARGTTFVSEKPDYD